MSQSTLQSKASNKEVQIFQERVVNLPCSNPSKLDSVNLTASEMPEVFRHEPLDLDPSNQCIRLLKVTSTSRDSVHYELLNNVRLRDQPRFVALSYEWGHESPLYPIKINGTLLKIRRNLHAFLQRFIELQAAYPGGEGLPMLWVDAISINQADNLERNHQVSQMKQIYSQAEEVMIWLGEPAPFSSEAVSAVLAQCTEIFDSVSRKSTEEPSLDTIYVSNRARQDSRSLRSLLTLAIRTYWTRIWIVQEILSSRSARMLCGEYVIPFEKWAETLRYSASHEERKLVRETLISSSAMHIAEQWMFHRLQNRSRGILSLMVRFTTSLASDQHDKIYALLGIANDAEHLTIDYDAPASIAVAQAIGTTCWNLSSSQFDTLCQSMGIGRLEAHAALDPYLYAKIATTKDDPSSMAQVLLIDDQRFRTAYQAQVVLSETRTSTELVRWSSASRVKLCSCIDCQNAGLLQASRRAELSFLYTSPDFCLMQPFRPTVRSAEPLLVYDGKAVQADSGEIYYDFQYLATAVFIGRDIDDFLSSLLLYFDPDMPRWHVRREITLLQNEYGVPSHQVAVKRLPMQKFSLAQSCRWYAHVLRGRWSSRDPSGRSRAIGHQTREYRELDDVLLHGFFPPDFEPFEVSTETRSSILHPSRSKVDAEEYHEVMRLLRPCLVSHEILGKFSDSDVPTDSDEDFEDC